MSWWILAAAVLLVTATARAESPGPMRFSVTETAGRPGPRLATVSFPFAPGEVQDLAAARLTGPGGTIPAQVRVLNRHAGGSVRRALVRFVWDPVANAAAEFALEPAEPPGAGQVKSATADAMALSSGPRAVATDGMSVILLRGEVPECRVTFHGLDYPLRFLGPEVTVIEDGPWFSWVALAWYGGPWNVTCEVQADALGQVRLTSRLRRTTGGPTAVPLFGLELAGLAPELSTATPQKLPFSAVVADGPRVLRFGSGPAATVVQFPDGPQIRQGRLAVEAVDGRARLALVRDASLDQSVADEHKQFHEGQERAVEVLLPPPGRPPLTCAATIPTQRRCVAVMGEAPVAYGGLRRVRQLNSERAMKLVCRDGDQYGDVTTSVNRHDPRWSITGLTRIDTGLDMIEDYYHGGDARLRDLAVGWAENWVSLKQYRGWDANSYGGERYTMAHWQYVPSYGQKGIMMIAYAFEETGDPRYREAALSFAERVVQQLKTRAFVAGTGTGPTSIGGDANIRPGYLGRDLVLMYRWTGNRDYLDAARRIFHGLALLRTGDHGLLREGYGDPYSPFERLVTGTDLGVTEDNSDHLKPYILEYLLEGAQYVYEETRDAVARATMVCLSEFMLDAMQSGGFWNYAQRHAAEGNSVGHMTIEIANGLLKSYQLTGDRRYRDAAFNSFHCTIKAFDTYGSLLQGVFPPADRTYFYPGDHCDLDFYRGTVGLDNITRDETGYLFCALDRMLRIDPQADALLLSPVTEPRHRWLVEQVPIAGGDFVKEQGHNTIARVDFGRDGDRESGGKSELVLLEDGRPLGPAHSLHQAIRDQGQGRYSHWTRTSLYFSSSDHTDPLTNGRRYTWYFGDPASIPVAAEQHVLPTVAQPWAARRPHPAVDLYQRGLTAEREQRWADAVAVWEEVLRQWPDSAPELYRQVDLWRQAGDPAAMADTCRRFLGTFRNHDRAPEVSLTLVTYLLAGGQQPEARKLLEEAGARYGESPWGEEARVRLWRELGLGAAPEHVVHAVPGTTPRPQPLTALRASDGLPSPTHPQVGAAYDDRNLYLRLVLPVGAWPSPDAQEAVRLFLDPHGAMTSYQVYVIASTGRQEERPAMWHNRQQGYVVGEGWTARVERLPDGWTAELTLPFAKLGFQPEPGRHTWRFGYRWDSLSGMKFWRPSLPLHTRPHDCGWLVFD